MPRSLKVCCLIASLVAVPIALGQATSQPTSESKDDLLEFAKSLKQPKLPPLPADKPLAPDKLFALASPGVVEIRTKDDDGYLIATGSGFLVREDPQATRALMLSYQKRVDESTEPGCDDPYDRELQEFAESLGPSKNPLTVVYVVTNYHVIRGATTIEIKFKGEYTKAWNVMAEDATQDIAILRVGLTPPPSRAFVLSPNTPNIGIRVFAIGNPYGLTNTLSDGLLSGYREINGQRLIQHTASISPGSSGGPLLSATGEVIGMATSSIRDAQNLNFAVPSDSIRSCLASAKGQRHTWNGTSIRKQVGRNWAQIWIVARCLYLQETQKSAGRDADAYKAFLEQSTNQIALLQLAEEAKELGQPHLELLQRAVQARPEWFDFFAHYALAKVLTDSGNYSEALQHAKRSAEIKPAFAPSHYLVAQIQADRGKYPELLLAADRLVRLVPNNSNGYRLRARAWAHLDRRLSFEKDIAIAIELSPNDPYCLRGQGIGYLRLKQFALAIPALERALAVTNSIDNPMFDYSKSKTWVAIGDCHYNLKQAREALRAYERAIELGYDRDHLQTQHAFCRQQLR